MTLRERLRQLASVLPSDGASITLSRADLLVLVEGESEGATLASRDLTVHEVAEETGRAPSTVRGWLIAEVFRGYKLNGRDWRVPRTCLREYLAAQNETSDPPSDARDVDITAWRRVGGA